MEQEPADVGSRLRRAREQRALTIRDIANTTKISMAALKAIERNDFAQLPGGVYTRSYVRAFAAEVGLSPDELVIEYRSQFEPVLPAEPIEPREVDDRDRFRALLQWAAPALGVGMLIYASLPSKPTETRPEAEVAEQLALLTAHELEDSDSALASASAVGGTALPALRLEIRLLGLCWVSAVADGEPVVYRLMQAGETAVVTAHDAIVLRVGDAGTFTYAINGVTGRPLGRSGEAVTVHITEESYRLLYEGVGSATRYRGAARTDDSSLTPILKSSRIRPLVRKSSRMAARRLVLRSSIT
jgi:transcriptional regulator with XRE-family HTH domain